MCVCVRACGRVCVCVIHASKISKLMFYVCKPNINQKKKTINPTITCNVNLIEKPKTRVVYLILHKFYEFDINLHMK